MNTDSENASICMDILVREVGIINTERFVAYMNRESGDYTATRHELFRGMTSADLREELMRFEREHPEIREFFEAKSRIRERGDGHPSDRSAIP